MFYALSKTLDILLSPLTWAIAFAAASALRARHWFRWAGLAAACILVTFSCGHVSNALVRHLEREAPSTIRAGITYDAAILLGGAVDHDATRAWGKVSYNNNSERLLATFDLLRTGRAKNAILSGGSAPDDPVNEARTLGDQLAVWGIDRSRLILEDRAMNTAENAVKSALLVRERGFRTLVIVTSAFHMSRALDCFRAVGLDVDADPVDYRSFDPATTSLKLLPRSDSLADSTAALRELAGRLVYRVSGRGK